MKGSTKNTHAEWIKSTKRQWEDRTKEDDDEKSLPCGNNSREAAGEEDRDLDKREETLLYAMARKTEKAKPR